MIATARDGGGWLVFGVFRRTALFGRIRWVRIFVKGFLIVLSLGLPYIRPAFFAMTALVSPQA